jgi:hypothetical protein
MHVNIKKLCAHAKPSRVRFAFPACVFYTYANLPAGLKPEMEATGIHGMQTGKKQAKLWVHIQFMQQAGPLLRVHCVP